MSMLNRQVTPPATDCFLAAIGCTFLCVGNLQQGVPLGHLQQGLWELGTLVLAGLAIGFVRAGIGLRLRATDEDYQQEFRRLIREMRDSFAMEDTPREELLHAMDEIQREMNGNGGCNWREEDYVGYMDTLHNVLVTETSFSGRQLDGIRWSIEEIIECGRELETVGDSWRGATEAVDYLVARVVDWCHRHPLES